MTKTLRLYFLTRTDNFEGDIKYFIQSETFKDYGEIKKAIADMAENSDGEMSHEPLYLTGLDGGIIINYKEGEQ